IDMQFLENRNGVRRVLSIHSDSRRVLLFVSLATLFCSVLGFQANVFGNSTPTGNVTGKATGAGCSGCHGASADGTLSVVITGPATLTAGSLGTYTITATKSGIANATKMGFDLIASDGTLSIVAGQSTALTGSEITHSASVGALATTTSNSANYTFKYTMPAAAAVGSNHTLSSVSALGFVGWNYGTNFTVTVPPPAPAVTSSAAANGTVGQAFSYQITGTNSPTSYAVTGTLPTNVTINTINGQISGTPTNSGTFNVNVTASNAGGTSAPQPLAITIAPASAATTRYVNAATGVNTGTCAVQSSPCKTITYGMSQSSAGNPGDLLSVAPGTYDLALGEVFPIVMRSGVQLIATGSPADTFIDAVGDTVKQAIVTSANNTSAFARIEGFTFRNGRNLTPTQGGVSLGGAIRLSNSSALFTITRNIFTGNQTTGYTADNTSGQTGGLGWGGAIYGFSSTVEISNNVFTSNIALGGNGYTDFSTSPCTNRNAGQGEGGAIYIFGSGKIVNNTFYGNVAQGGAGGGGQACTGNGGTATSGAVTTGSGITVSNNIFAANGSVGGAGAAAGSASAGAMSASGATITNNLFFGNTLSGTAGSADTTGSNVLTSDPQFHSAPSILKILIGSPASGTGTSTGAPALDFAGTTRPTPPAMGAYEPSSAITLLAVQSRKTHGVTGDYDIAIDTAQAIGGFVTVEPRTIGSGHSIVFQFSGTVTSTGTVSVTPAGAVVAAIGANTSEVVVTLTGVADNQRATVMLTGVNGSVNPPAASIGFLVGDINNTRSVNSSDISGVKARSGQVTTAANFKFDLNANGSVNSSDISAVKARSGLVLP
ncbi:MAG: choice-of-anchor V domain-containing protein, partial [Betaproteobacteria bacterium]